MAHVNRPSVSMPSFRARVSIAPGAHPRGLERRRSMVKLFRLGWSIPDIAERHRATHAFVERVLREAWRAERAKHETVRSVGAKLANCAFNVKQRAKLTDRDREVLGETQAEWDREVRRA